MTDPSGIACATIAPVETSIPVSNNPIKRTFSLH